MCVPAISCARDNKLLLVETRPRSILTANTLSNSLGWAGGISLTFLSSTFLWRKVFAGFRLLLVFAVIFFFSLTWSHLLFLKQMKSWPLSFILFLQRAARLLLSTVKYYRCVRWLDQRCIFSVVRFSGCWVVYFVRILRGLFSGVNLIAYEIYWTCPSGNVLVNLVPKPLFLPNKGDCENEVALRLVPSLRISLTRMIVVPRKVEVSKTNMLVLRTSNF